MLRIRAKLKVDSAGLSRERLEEKKFLSKKKKKEYNSAVNMLTLL